MREKIREVLIELIRFESIATKPEELKGIVDHVESLLSPAGLFKKRYERNGKHSIVFTFEDTKKPEVLFVGHLDVVDADKEDFEPRIEDDRIYGRGALDMKGPDSVMIVLFEELAQKGEKYPIGLMLTTDEEVGSTDGVAYLLKEEGWSADFAIIPDGGHDFALVTESKGVLHAILKAKGKSAHGSQPWNGDNALEKLLNFYNDLKAEFPHEPCGDPEHWHNTINLGRMKGGDSVNRVPDSAEMGIDIRFVSPWTVKKMREFVQRKLSLYEGIEMEVLSTGEVMYTSPDNRYLRLYKECSEKVLGREVTFAREHGATDGRYFSEKGIPVVITYPIGDNIHGKNEWVSLDSLEELYKIFKEFVLSLR